MPACNKRYACGFYQFKRDDNKVTQFYSAVDTFVGSFVGTSISCSEKMTGNQITTRLIQMRLKICTQSNTNTSLPVMANDMPDIMLMEIKLHIALYKE